MFVYRIAASAAFLSLLFSATARADVVADDGTGDKECWSAEEVPAAHIINLQTALMIDSLKCRDTIPATLESYTSFESSKRDLLMSHRNMLQAHFVRRLGAVRGVDANDSYTTKLGNELSVPVVDVARCERTGAFARMAAVASPEDLLVLADTISRSRLIADCPTSEHASGKPVAMVIPVWKKSAPIAPMPIALAAGPPVAVTEPVAAAPIKAVAVVPAPAPALPVAPEAVKPTAAVAVVPAPVVPAPVVPEPDAATALKAAALALAQAASAMQAQAASATVAK